MMHQQVKHSTLARSTHTVCVYTRVLYLSENKQRFLPYAT